VLELLLCLLPGVAPEHTGEFGDIGIKLRDNSRVEQCPLCARISSRRTPSSLVLSSYRVFAKLPKSHFRKRSLAERTIPFFFHNTWDENLVPGVPFKNLTRQPLKAR
jgi:hypothetical protein